MNFSSGLVVFFITWWVAIFAVLPFSAKQPEFQEKGIMAGTPMQPNMKKVVLRTTILTIVLWLIIYGLIESNVISFTDMAKQFAIQDKL
ncbi:MAG: DUF1467 family protein [Alphaproteobacteria bacterium]|nr:DUF1467 family protein [Alphaproteobacteria bacterium]